MSVASAMDEHEQQSPTRRGAVSRCSFDVADDPRRRPLASALHRRRPESQRGCSVVGCPAARVSGTRSGTGCRCRTPQLRAERRAVRPILRTGTCRTSAIQPRGLRPRSRPGPRPRPTAGGYSSRSKPSRIGTSRNRRSRRSSAPGRFTTNRSGQPRRATARPKCRRMFGYSAALKMSRCTPSGRTHSRAARSGCWPVVAVGQHATASTANVTANSLRTRASLAATPVVAVAGGGAIPVLR